MEELDALEATGRTGELTDEQGSAEASAERNLSRRIDATSTRP
jgi:hypothetical protein